MRQRQRQRRGAAKAAPNLAEQEEEQSELEQSESGDESEEESEEEEEEEKGEEEEEQESEGQQVHTSKRAVGLKKRTIDREEEGNRTLGMEMLKRFGQAGNFVGQLTELWHHHTQVCGGCMPVA